MNGIEKQECGLEASSSCASASAGVLSINGCTRRSSAATRRVVKGVLSGVWIERSEVGLPGEFDHMSDEELRQSIIDEARELGFILVERDAALKATVRKK